MKAWFKSSWKTLVILWRYEISVLRVCPSGVIPAVCSLQRHSRAPWGSHQLSIFWHLIMRMVKERCHFRRTDGMDRCPSYIRYMGICGIEFLPALCAYCQRRVQAASRTGICGSITGSGMDGPRLGWNGTPEPLKGGDDDGSRYSGPVGTLRALTVDTSLLLALTAAIGVLYEDLLLLGHFLVFVPMPFEWVHGENKDKSGSFSFYTLGLVAPGAVAALFYKNLCVYLSSTILSHCLTWKLPPI